MDQARSLPTGTVTVLLADVVSSSPLWQTGTERTAEVFARLNALVEGTPAIQGNVRVAWEERHDI